MLSTSVSVTGCFVSPCVSTRRGVRDIWVSEKVAVDAFEEQ